MIDEQLTAMTMCGMIMISSPVRGKVKSGRNTNDVFRLNSKASWASTSFSSYFSFHSLTEKVEEIDVNTYPGIMKCILINLLEHVRSNFLHFGASSFLYFIRICQIEEVDFKLYPKWNPEIHFSCIRSGSKLDVLQKI